MTKFFEKYRRDIVGVIWLATGLFLFLSLLSFDPKDPSFNTIGSGHTVHNYCGYIGSFIADLVFQVFGMTSWLIVFGICRMAYRCFSGKNTEFINSGLVLAILLQMTVASLISLHLPNKRIYLNQILASGVLGAVLTKGLVSAFNFLGVSIILWSLALVLLVFYTDKSIKELVKFPQKALFAIIHSEFHSKIISSLQAFFAYLQMQPAVVGASREQNVEKKASKTRFKLFERQVDTRQKTQIESKSVNTDQHDQDEEFEVEADIFVAKPVIESSGQLALPVNSPEEEAPRRRVRMTAKVERRIENWKLPELSLLEDPPASRIRIDEREIQRKADVLVDKLNQFSVKGEVKGAKPGPAVTMYEFKPNADVKISKITELADDLSLALSSESVRIIAPIPGRDVVGIETSNSQRETVYLKDILANDMFWSDKMKLPIALGRQADGETRVVDLRKMPHLLVAGTTGSGKSVFVVSAITGLLFRHSPKTLRLILVDPKQVDLAAFSNVPHLLMPPIREPKKAVVALKWAIREMEKRYRSMSKFGARGIEGFNETVEKFSKSAIEEHELVNQSLENDGRKNDQYYYSTQPYIVIVVEEFGDLMAVDKVNVEQSVVRLAQMARACGIHLVLAMQSPRKDVVTGLIKTNIPGRMSFKVASKMDSRIILDDSGAERLLAQGDMLFLAPGVAKPLRHHGPWVTEHEIASIMKFWSDQGEPQYDQLAMKALEGSGGGYEFGSSNGEDGGEEESFGDDEGSEYDDRYDEILAYTSSMKEVSASLLQRKFRLGYPRAARMIEKFEREGVVGPANGSKPRQVLISSYKEN